MFDEEIEKAVLFYIIFENEDLEIYENDFIGYENKEIAKVILELKRLKQPISLLTVQNKINSDNPSKVLMYLSSLGENVFGTECMVAYNKLKELTKKRKLLEFSQTIQKEILDIDNIDEYINGNIVELNKIYQEGIVIEETFESQVVQTANIIERRYKGEKNISYETGIYDLDKLTNGLHNQELTVIGARPRSW